MPDLRRKAARGTGMARIADVARAAGVSTATVSRALSDPAQVRDGTRDRVLAAVRTLGYTPNAAARHLRAGTSRTILVVIPRRSNPPFFAEVLHGAETELSAAGYAVVMGNAGDAQQGERLVELARSGRLDGVLILSGLAPAADGRTVFDAGVPVVAVCAEIEGFAAPAVVIDDEGCGRLQAEHLIGLGHRRLMYVAGPEGNYNEVRRFRGFSAAAAGCAVLRVPGDYMLGGGIAAAHRFLALAERPTGIACGNDETAIGFLKTVRDAGVAVPREVSVVGFDGIEFAEFCEPPLTTIVQPRFEMGALGARLLVAAMREGAAPAPPRVMPARLVARGSTGPAPG